MLRVLLRCSFQSLFVLPFQVVSSADSSFNTGLNDSFPTPIPGSTCFYSSPCRTDAAPSPTSSTYNVRADRSPAAYPGSRHPLSAASPAVDGSKLWKTPADEPDCVKNHSTHTSQTPLAMYVAPCLFEIGSELPSIVCRKQAVVQSNKMLLSCC